MYTMKQACTAAEMPYETLKFYCNEGLVPNVKRGENNYRMFDEHDINWIKSLACLKKCGMSIAEMKEYLALCLQGESSIPQRQVLLEKYRLELEKKLEDIKKQLEFIDWKQGFYSDVLAGRVKSPSDLIAEE